MPCYLTPREASRESSCSFPEGTTLILRKLRKMHAVFLERPPQSRVRYHLEHLPQSQLLVPTFVSALLSQIEELGSSIRLLGLF
jgi:hypothetical protein